LLQKDKTTQRAFIVGWLLRTGR